MRASFGRNTLSSLQIGPVDWLSLTKETHQNRTASRTVNSEWFFGPVVSTGSLGVSKSAQTKQREILGQSVLDVSIISHSSDFEAHPPPVPHPNVPAVRLNWDFEAFFSCLAHHVPPQFNLTLTRSTSQIRQILRPRTEALQLLARWLAEKLKAIRAGRVGSNSVSGDTGGGVRSGGWAEMVGVAAAGGCTDCTSRGVPHRAPRRQKTPLNFGRRANSSNKHDTTSGASSFLTSSEFSLILKHGSEHAEPF